MEVICPNMVITGPYYDRMMTLKRRRVLNYGQIQINQEKINQEKCIGNRDNTQQAHDIKATSFGR